VAVQTFARGLVIVTIFFGTIAVCVLLQVVFGQTNAGTTALAAIAALGVT